MCLLCSGWLNTIFIGSSLQVWKELLYSFYRWRLGFPLSGCVIWESQRNCFRSKLQTQSCVNSTVHVLLVTRWYPTFSNIMILRVIRLDTNSKREMSPEGLTHMIFVRGRGWEHRRVTKTLSLEPTSDVFSTDNRLQQTDGIPIITAPSLYGSGKLNPEEATLILFIRWWLTLLFFPRHLCHTDKSSSSRMEDILLFVFPASTIVLNNGKELS